MLQDIRDRLTGKFAIAILALIALPFVFFGINYNFIGQGFAAKVNGEEIPVFALENAYRNELARYAEQGTELPQQFRQLLREGVLDMLIREEVIDQYVQEHGYRIPDRLLTDAIQRTPEFREDGRFSRDLYYQWLNERAVEPAVFEASQREQMRQNQMQRGVGGTAFVTPADYRRYLNLYGEQRQVAWAVFDVAAIAETVEVTDEEIQALYDARPEAYMAPESVDLAYVELRRDDVADDVEVTENELAQYYEAARSRYLQDESRQARHILIPFGDDEAAARELATSLTERARAGEPFEDLARDYSQDGGTAQQGGDLGMLLQTQLPGALGDAIFSMEEGEIRGPVESEFGFHVIRLDTVQPGGPLPLDQVRAELLREIRAEQADALWREKERALSDALFDAADMAALAEQVGLELKTAEGYTRSGGEPFGSNQAVIDAVFSDRSLQDRFISDIVELDANRAIVFRVTDYQPATRQPLEAVRDEIEAELKRDRAVAIADEQAVDLQRALRQTTDIAAVREQFPDVEIQERVIGRAAPDVDASIRASAFQEKKPEPDQPAVGTVITQDGNYAVYSVLAAAPGRPEAIPLAERDAGKLRLAQQAGGADYAAFVTELVEAADVVKSEEALEQQSLFD